jgi:serine/threonine-protein kinase
LRRLAAHWPRVPFGFVIALAGVALVWNMSTRPAALTRVPELTGLRADAAAALAATHGLRTKNVRVLHGGPTSAVVDQTPASGTFLERGGLITLDVASGAPQVVVPNVTGMPFDQARAAIERARLDLGAVIYKAIPRREPGRVVMTSPPPRSRVDEGTSVDVTMPLPRG